MADAEPFARLDLSIAGLGFILYSPFAVAHIADGENYLRSHFWKPEDVAQHVNACSLTGFCTGSPGEYHLAFIHGPRPATVSAAVAIRLGIEVRDGIICVRDLYDLLRWEAECPTEQQVPLANGFYRLTLLTDPPASGVLGDDQQITVYFEPVSRLPAIYWPGVPELIPADHLS